MQLQVLHRRTTHPENDQRDHRPRDDSNPLKSAPDRQLHRPLFRASTAAATRCKVCVTKHGKPALARCAGGVGLAPGPLSSPATNRS